MKRKARYLRGFFVKFLLQPLIHQGLDVDSAFGGLLFDLIQQFEMDGYGGNDVKVSVGRVGIKLSEVVAVPKLAHLLIIRSRDLLEETARVLRLTRSRVQSLNAIRVPEENQ
jgi:hypothetical protein